MQDLCMKLGIKDIGLMKKIWTCFEYCIVHHIELMQDRHLDQILMCSIYVICKVAHTNVSFALLNSFTLDKMLHQCGFRA